MVGSASNTTTLRPAWAMRIAAEPVRTRADDDRVGMIHAASSLSYVASAFPPQLVTTDALRRAGSRTATVRLKADTTYTYERVFHVCHAEVTVDEQRPPDVVLLSADRRTRAPLRAQLIEDGFEVVGTETWPAMRAHLRPGAKPGVAIVDLQGLPNPTEVLDGLPVLMTPGRVLVLTALGTVPPEEIARAGFRVVHRPASIEEVVTAARSALAPVTQRRSGPG